MKKICPNCGAETEGNFCPDCGTNLTNVEGQSDAKVEDAPKESLLTEIDNVVASEENDNQDVVELKDNSLSEPPEVSVSDPVETVSTAAMPDSISSQKTKQKKVPKKLIGIIAAVVVVAAAACAVLMFMGNSSNVITKAYEEGTTEQKIGELSYLMPQSWKIDDTFTNQNEFYETQRYLVKAEDGSDAVDCYVRYCGESRYYGNTLADYETKNKSDETTSEEGLSLTGADGKHFCTEIADAEGNKDYVDVYLVEADGSIFMFEFDTNESSHDQNGMNTIVSNAQFSSYKTPVQEAIVGKGKFSDSSNTIMRQLICEMNKNNDSESLGCGNFTYQEGSTKGGALCYVVYENGNNTGVAISFYKDKKDKNPVDSFNDIPVQVSVASTLQGILDYQDTTVALINSTMIQLTGNVKYKQAYSKYINGVEEATGITGQNWYTNSFALNDFDYSIGFDTEDYGLYVSID